MVKIQWATQFATRFKHLLSAINSPWSGIDNILLKTTTVRNSYEDHVNSTYTIILAWSVPEILTWRKSWHDVSLMFHYTYNQPVTSHQTRPATTCSNSQTEAPHSTASAYSLILTSHALDCCKPWLIVTELGLSQRLRTPQTPSFDRHQHLSHIQTGGRRLVKGVARQLLSSWRTMQPGLGECTAGYLTPKCTPSTKKRKRKKEPLPRELWCNGVCPREDCVVEGAVINRQRKQNHRAHITAQLQRLQGVVHPPNNYTITSGQEEFLSTRPTT